MQSNALNVILDPSRATNHKFQSKPFSIKRIMASSSTSQTLFEVSTSRKVRSVQCSNVQFPNSLIRSFTTAQSGRKLHCCEVIDSLEARYLRFSLLAFELPNELIPDRPSQKMAGISWQHEYSSLSSHHSTLPDLRTVNASLFYLKIELKEASMMFSADHFG